MRLVRAAFIALALAAIFSCTSKERQAPEKEEGVVNATADYLRHFGPAPVVRRGTAYAFVIYFPSAKEPGKVIPFPFFSFDQASLKKVALGKLVGGIAEMQGYEGEVAQPFPPGTRVLSISQSGGVVTANFSEELASAKETHALDAAVALTLRQFEGVDKVAIQVEGQPAMGKTVETAAGNDVVKLKAPRLLSVTAMREKGETNVEEVDAFFDRPVEIKELRLMSPDGKVFEGEIFHSVFDMAGVLKPKDPGRFTAGMPVKVRWDVTDKLGRSSSGEREMILEVREH